jgi:hypothetical protein
MADIGRFFNVDPLSDKYYHNSPYAFSENKVVAHIELEGLESISLNALTNGESSKYENMSKPLLRAPAPTGPPTGGDKALQGTGNILFGAVSAAAVGTYVIGTDGAGAALGGGFAFTFALGEIALGIAQLTNGISEMAGGPSDKSGILEKSNSLPGVVANATGSEHAEMIDVVGQLVPGMLSGGNLKALKEGWSVIKSSKTAGEATVNILNTADAVADTEGLIEAGIDEVKKQDTDEKQNE